MILEHYSKKQKQVLKCVTPVIPRAKNAIFREIEGSEELHFIRLRRDPKRPDDEYGHISIQSGDSGGPLWRECKDGKAELIAVWLGTRPRHASVPLGAYSSSQYEQDLITKCANFATRITRQMVEWFRLIEISN